MSEVEVLARVERRRRWTPAEKAALLAEVEAEGVQDPRCGATTRDFGEPAV
jgi:hypothetical protein